MKPKEDYVSLYNEGTNLLKAGELEKALPKFERALKLNDMDPELFCNLGVVHLHLGHYERALEFLNRSLELEDNHPLTLLNKGLLLSILTKYDESIQSLETLLKYNPDFNHARTLLMETKRNKEFYGTIEISEKGLSPKIRETFRMGLSRLHHNKLDQAEELFLDVIKKQPDFAEAYLHLGIIMTHRKIPQAGLDYLDKALKYKPELAHAWSQKGQILDSLQQYDKAIECYDKAISLDPNFSVAWNNKGLAFDIQDKFEEALECFNKSIELNPDYGGVWYNRATTHKKLNHIENALADYQKCLTLNPRNEDAKRHIDQLRVWSSAGQEGVMRSVHDARDYCPRCGKKNYTNASVCQHCGTAMFTEDIDKLLEKTIELENRGLFEEALVKFVRINNLAPTRGEVWFFRGKAHCALGEFKNALICLGKAEQLGFKAIQLMMYGLMARSNLDNFESPNLTPTHLKTVDMKHHGLFPDEETWCLNGAALQMLGQYEEAYKCYLKALEIKPTYTIALKNKEHIESLAKKEGKKKLRPVRRNTGVSDDDIATIAQSQPSIMKCQMCGNLILDGKKCVICGHKVGLI